MCQGTVTHLRCPHQLAHFDTRCEKNCKLPQGPQFSLDDTCAACHLKYSPAYIRAYQERKQMELTEKIRVANNAGNVVEAKKHEAELNLLTAECYQLRAASKRYMVPRNLEGVLWPGSQEW